jgi:hypothetical protein
MRMGRPMHWSVSTNSEHSELRPLWDTFERVRARPKARSRDVGSYWWRRMVGE